MKTTPEVGDLRYDWEGRAYRIVAIIGSLLLMVADDSKEPIMTLYVGNS